MRLNFIILLLLFSFNLYAQDSLNFEFDDTTFIVGQEKKVEFRWAFCFPFGASNESLNTLDSIKEFLISNPKIIISITFHTDTRGSLDGNKKLSIQRASAIKKELIEQGISNTRIETYGKGESEPIVGEEEINKYKTDNPDKFEELHSLNRRTVIRIVGI